MYAKFTRQLYRPMKHLSESLQVNGVSLLARTMSSSPNYDFSTLKVTSPSEFVKHVELNRPEKRNAMNTDFWREMRECFRALAVDKDCRVVILSGSGKLFTSGLDLQANEVFSKMMSEMDVGRKYFFMRQAVQEMQESFNVLEKCPKPVIAAVHSGCVGGGIDMICACDIRYSTQDAWFTIKEVDIGLAADLGTLQRFQKIVGNDGVSRELAYTARRFYSDEAKDMGLIGRVFPNKDDMLKGALELADTIASKSPVAVQASKLVMVYSRDHSVSDSLDYQVQMNCGLLQSEDVMKAAMATMNKEKPVFAKL